MEKYYVPTIEEMHAGFVFEANDQQLKDWCQTVFGSLLINNEGGMYTTDLKRIATWISNGDVRVKFLDREDIEACGWKRYGTEKGLLSDRPTFVNNYCLLSFQEEGGWINIFNTTSDIQIFSGKIKNKSELSRLMKQLGIIN